MIDQYDWAGGREAMMRFGPADGPVVIVALPLFEEANRTRTFVVGMLRQLGARGIASVLPDLPGTGESLVPTMDASLANWRAAFAGAVDAAGGAQCFAVSMRGGALIDSLAQVAGRWQLAPLTGSDVVRELMRIRTAALREQGNHNVNSNLYDNDPTPLEVAGNLISRGMLAELSKATPASAGPVRVVRLGTDARPADRKVAGAPLWRQAEPGDDSALATMLAEDIASWVRACAG